MKYSETRQDITTAVKEQSDIVQVIGEVVQLKKSGVRYLGLCPFHGEKTPSFSVHSVQQFYHCFGCGESGDVFSFIMKHQNLDFPTALKYLADRCNIELPKKTFSPRDREIKRKRQLMYTVSEKAAGIYRNYLMTSKEAEAARQYLKKRGISEEIQEKFGIGYAPSKESAGWNFLETKLTAGEVVSGEEVGLLVKNDRGGRYDRFRDRILFPIFDIKGRICGFGGRIVGEGQPKYMNSPESPIFSKGNTLLGLFQQSGEIRRSRSVVLVEGNFDMVSLVNHGCENVVAPLGTALTISQVRLLNKYAEEAVLFFDGDEAGIKAAQRAAPLFLKEKMRASVALLPRNHDPDTYIREKGLGAITTLIQQAVELPEFVLDQLVKEHGLSLEGKSAIVEELNPLASAAVSPLQRSVVISHFGERLGIQPEQLENSLKSENITRGRPLQERSQERAAEPQVLEPLTSAQRKLVEFMVMNPMTFHRLEEAGIRESLQGSMGEILFLQVQAMQSGGEEVQPEEILSTLPEGPERSLVTTLLLEASTRERMKDEGGGEELGELVEYLELRRMQNVSNELSGKIVEAQQKDDFITLEKLLDKKQIIEKEMQKYRD